MQYSRYASIPSSAMPPGMAMPQVVTRPLTMTPIPMPQGMGMLSALQKLQSVSMPSQQVGLPQTGFYRPQWSGNFNPNRMPMGHPSIPLNSPYGPMSYRPLNGDPTRSYSSMPSYPNQDYYRTRDEQGVTYTYGPRTPSRTDPFIPDPPYE